jgi:hypothetical protein
VYEVLKDAESDDLTLCCRGQHKAWAGRSSAGEQVTQEASFDEGR